MTTETTKTAEAVAPGSDGASSAIGGGESPQEISSLLGEVMPSIEELSGEVSTETKKEAEASEKTEKSGDKEADKKTETDSSKSASSDDKSKEGAEGAKKEGEEKKPPEGYVEVKALQEAREENKKLKTQITETQNALLAKIAELEEKISKPAEKKADDKPDPEAERWKDFKVKTRDELKKLIEDDPVEAQIYQNDLIEYKDYQKKQESVKAEAETKTKAENEKLMTAINEAAKSVYLKIDAEVPGIYKKENGISEKMLNFAESLDIPPGFLSIFTDPKTIIKPSATGQENILGNGALYVVRLVNKLLQSHESKSNLEKDIEKKYADKFEADKKAWVADIEKKLKSSDREFTSLADIAASNSSGDIGGPKVLSEAALKKLNKQDFERYLQGNL